MTSGTISVPLGSVARFINGAAFKPTDWSEDGARIIRIQNLNDPDKPYNRTNRVVSSDLQVHPGDLLVSWSASLGTFQWEGPDVALLNQHIFRVVPDVRQVDKTYLKYALQVAVESMKHQVHGATMQHINRGEFLATEIPLPPIGEQRRIAAILDKADHLRVKRRMAVAVFDTLPLALFDEMFGDPATNPKGWERTLLGDLLSGIESGSSPVCLSRPAEPGEWGVLKLGAVTKCIFDDTENKALPPDVPPSKQHEVKVGDLLFSRKNTRLLVGASALVTSTQQRLLLSDLIFRLKIKPQAPLVATYLHQLLIHPSKRTQIQKLAGGTAGSMPNISKARLMGSSVEVPPVELQEAFAEKVSSTMDLTSVAKASIPHIDDLFASIQQRAFQGSL